MVVAGEWIGAIAKAEAAIQWTTDSSEASMSKVLTFAVVAISGD